MGVRGMGYGVELVGGCTGPGIWSGMSGCAGDGIWSGVSRRAGNGYGVECVGVRVCIVYNP